jgi:hypothetical protein
MEVLRRLLCKGMKERISLGGQKEVQYLFLTSV